MEKPTKKTVVAWRNFLATLEGQAGLNYIQQQTPVPSPDEDGKMIFAAGKSAGYHEVFSNMEAMLEDATRVTPNETPDRLED